MFSESKKCPSTHHDLPAIHHNFTTKTPRVDAHFREKPLQKRTFTTRKNNREKLELSSQPERSGTKRNVHIAQPKRQSLGRAAAALKLAQLQFGHIEAALH
jgi:hypothetical protein